MEGTTLLSERLISRMTRLRRMRLQGRFEERAHDLDVLHPRTGRWMTPERIERLRTRGEQHLSRYLRIRAKLLVRES